MSYQTERDIFISRMEHEGLPLHVTQALLRAATTLQRYAELACSSEAADRDQVRCPQQGKQHKARCLCADYGSGPGFILTIRDAKDDRVHHRIQVLDPGKDARTLLEHMGKGYLDPLYRWSIHVQHGKIPRYQVREAALERRIAALLAEVSTAHANDCARRFNDSNPCTCPAQYSSRYVEDGTARDWIMHTQGDPRGYVLRVIPPSYAERNAGKDRFNLDSIGVPAREYRGGY